MKQSLWFLAGLGRELGSLVIMNLLYAIFTTVKLGDKERFDKKQIGVKEPFPVTNCQFTS